MLNRKLRVRSVEVLDGGGEILDGSDLFDIDPRVSAFHVSRADECISRIVSLE
jgi:hypothetical protein